MIGGGRLRVAALALCAGLLVSCTVGPSRRPDLVTSGPQAPRASSTVASSSAPPTGPGGAGRTAAPIQWRACPSGVPTSAGSLAFTLQCAELEVPLNYQRPDDATLGLAVVRAVTDSTAKDAPDLVVLDGPAGVNGRDQTAEVAARLPPALLASHAIVTIERRGVREMDCLSRESLTNLLALPSEAPNERTPQTLATMAETATFDCSDEIGPQISEFSSTAAADDLDSLRSALRLGTLQLLGRGDGATIAASYVHRYPARVGRAVLDTPADGAVDQVDAALARASALEKALAEFAASCTANAGCPLGRDPATAVATLVDGLGDVGRSAGGLLISGGSVLFILTRYLGDESSWPELTRALAAAGTGDGDLKPLSALLQKAADIPEGRHDLDIQLAYRCNNSGQRLTGGPLAAALAKAAKASALFGPYLIAEWAMCGAWPTATQPLGRLSGAGAPPVLVLGAVGDPVTPYSAVTAVVSQLSSARLLSWQSSAHLAFPASSCVSSAVQGYLDHGTLPPDSQLCPP